MNELETEVHCGFRQPKNPFLFGKTLQYSQKESYDSEHTILSSKGRYFETSFYNEKVLKEISELTQIPIQYKNMIIGSWEKMEDFITAMNCLGIYVRINIDWI